MNDFQKKKALHISESRSNGAMDSTFGFAMLIFAWVGLFALLSFNEDLEVIVRCMYATILPLMLLIPGVFLFQSYKLDLTTDYVIWQRSQPISLNFDKIACFCHNFEVN